MKTRTLKAIERAGAIDRAQRSLEAVKQESAKAYSELHDVSPEIAAVVAQVLVRSDEALRRLADV